MSYVENLRLFFGNMFVGLVWVFITVLIGFMGFTPS
jgi:hypothetical protein